MSDIAMFDALGFHWDRARATRPVDLLSVSEVLADFHRGMAGHVWATANLQGNTFTYPEVQTLLEGVTVGGRKVSDMEQILRLRAGHTLLRDLVASGQFALTENVSDALHAVIASGKARDAGLFRERAASASDVTAHQGEHGNGFPPRIEPVGADIRALHARGLSALAQCDAPFEKASAYFLFAAVNRFYLDGNECTARAMMNGVLLAAGVHAVLVPTQARDEFNETMQNFYADRDATAIMEMLASCGPRIEPTRTRLTRINRALRDPDSGRAP